MIVAKLIFFQFWDSLGKKPALNAEGQFDTSETSSSFLLVHNDPSYTHLTHTHLTKVPIQMLSSEKMLLPLHVWMSPTKLEIPSYTHLKGPAWSQEQNQYSFSVLWKEMTKEVIQWGSLSTWATLIYRMLGWCPWIPRPDFLPCALPVFLIPQISCKGDWALPEDISNTTWTFVEAELRFLTLRTE